MRRLPIALLSSLLPWQPVTAADKLVEPNPYLP